MKDNSSISHYSVPVVTEPNDDSVTVLDTSVDEGVVSTEEDSEGTATELATLELEGTLECVDTDDSRDTTDDSLDSEDTTDDGDDV